VQYIIRIIRGIEHVTCTHCGTVISDKAIICFKCGRPTADPSAPSSRPASASGRPLLVALAGLVVLVVAGLFMARAAAGQVPPALSYSIAALAAIVLVWRLARRRRS
jgi:hypothetical protein